MSEKHLQTRKTISTSVAVVGLSSVATVVGIVLKAIGVIAGGSLVSIASGVLLLAGIFYYFKSLTSFKDLEYGNANSQSWLAMIASITSTLLTFFV